VNQILRRKARRDLRRRRSQILAVAGTVFLGVMLFTSNLDASHNLGASYQSFYDRLNLADVWATGGPIDQLAADFSDNPNVTAVETRTRVDLPVRLGGRELVATVIGGPGGDESKVNQRYLMSGRDLVSSDAGVVVLEKHAADHFNLGPGDTVSLWDGEKWRDANVVGVAASGEYLFPARSHTEVFTIPDEFAVVFVPESFATDLAPAGPRQVMATVEGRDATATASLMAAARGAGSAEVYDLAGQPSNLALQSDVKGFESMSYLFPVLFLGAAGMATFVLLSRLVRQERTQIGMMVADGIGTGVILRHYMSHALFSTLLGALPGLIAGALLGRWMSSLYTSFIGVPITIVRYSVPTMLLALAFVVVVGLISGVLPARAAARIDPAEAMRPPTPTGVDHEALIERVWPVTLPMTVRVVARNMARNPRRVATTAFGVVLSMVVLVTSLALNDTTNSVIDRQFAEIDRRDLSVHLDHPVTDADLAALATLPEVAVVEPSLEMPVVISTDGARSEQMLQVFRADTVSHGFDQQLPADGIVLGSIARKDLGVAQDDVVTISIPGIGTAIQARVSGFVDEPIPAVSYTSLAAWEAAGGEAPTTAVVKLVNHDDHSSVREVLTERSDVVAVTDHRAMIDAIRELLTITVVFVGLMVLFAVLMAIGLLYNAVTVALAERTNEMATLQANGMPRRWIRTTVTAETLAVVVLGLAPGAVIGWWVAGRFMGQFDNESFSFKMVMSGQSMALAVVLVLVVAVVSEWPGLRRVDRLDLPSVVRERSV